MPTIANLHWRLFPRSLLRKEGSTATFGWRRHSSRNNWIFCRSCYDLLIKNDAGSRKKHCGNNECWSSHLLNLIYACRDRWITSISDWSLLVSLAWTLSHQSDWKQLEAQGPKMYSFSVFFLCPLSSIWRFACYLLSVIITPYFTSLMGTVIVCSLSLVCGPSKARSRSNIFLVSQHKLNTMPQGGRNG